VEPQGRLHAHIQRKNRNPKRNASKEMANSLKLKESELRAQKWSAKRNQPWRASVQRPPGSSGTKGSLSASGHSNFCIRRRGFDHALGVEVIHGGVFFAMWGRTPKWFSDHNMQLPLAAVLGRSGTKSGEAGLVGSAVIARRRRRDRGILGMVGRRMGGE
jgi:hypothetical protein